MGFDLQTRISSRILDSYSKTLKESGRDRELTVSTQGVRPARLHPRGVKHFASTECSIKGESEGGSWSTRNRPFRRSFLPLEEKICFIAFLAELAHSKMFERNFFLVDGYTLWVEIR